MEVKPRVTRRRAALLAAAVTVVAFGASAAAAATPPELVTPRTCEAVGELGEFSVEGGVRRCTTSHLAYDLQQIPGTMQWVPGPTEWSVWEYWGTWNVLTEYGLTTIESQVGAGPIETTTTTTLVGTSEGGACQRLLRDPITGIVLLWESDERPAAECEAAGVYEGL